MKRKRKIVQVTAGILVVLMLVTSLLAYFV